MLSHAQLPSFNRSEDPLALGHWHELHVSRTAKNGILQVDKQKVVEAMAEVRRTRVSANWVTVFFLSWREKQQSDG